MRISFIISILYILSGCTKIPELPSYKEIIVKEQIQKNQTEAQKAQEEYSRLQKQRSQE